MFMDFMVIICNMFVLIFKYVNVVVVYGVVMFGVKVVSYNGLFGIEVEMLWSIMDRMSKLGWLVEFGLDLNEKKLLDVKYEVFLVMCKS